MNDSFGEWKLLNLQPIGRYFMVGTLCTVERTYIVTYENMVGG